MPRRTSLVIEKTPQSYKSSSLRMHKSYTLPDFKSSTILTDDVFPYIEFYFSSHKKAMKYRDSASRTKYGNEKKYHYSFYWKQAMTFYYAAKKLPIESSPLLSYYSMLNAVKSFLSFKCEYIEDFVDDFRSHGLFENNDLAGTDLDTIAVARRCSGVYPLFGKMIEANFDTIWINGKATALSLKKLLYNLAFIHRSYVTTYNTSRNRKIPELFIPVHVGKAPCYHKANDSMLYLIIDVDKNFFSVNSSAIPNSFSTTISDLFTVKEDNEFALRSSSGAKNNGPDSISADLKSLSTKLRCEFQYIKSDRPLWYLKRSALPYGDVVNLNSMLIIMAVMHRMSEIVRYKPEQLAHLMDSKENWLIHEFLTLALDQFIDEISAEITGQDIMGTGKKF